MFAAVGEQHGLTGHCDSFPPQLPCLRSRRCTTTSRCGTLRGEARSAATMSAASLKDAGFRNVAERPRKLAVTVSPLCAARTRVARAAPTDWRYESTAPSTHGAGNTYAAKQGIPPLPDTSHHPPLPASTLWTATPERCAGGGASQRVNAPWCTSSPNTATGHRDRSPRNRRRDSAVATSLSNAHGWCIGEGASQPSRLHHHVANTSP